MESFPYCVLRRELGFNRTVGLSVKQRLASLTWKTEDRVVVSAKNPIYSMEFCPLMTQPKIIAVSDEIGGVTLIDTQTNSQSKIVSQHQCHGSSLYTVTWSIPRPNLIATGASDQTVCVWDANSFQKLATFTGHSKTVRRVRFHPSKPDMFGSGGRDGTILLWDLRTGSTVMPENEIYSAHSISSPIASPMYLDRKSRRPKKCVTPTPVTDFLFVDENTLISCGATDGQIKFWDIRKTYKYLQKVEPVRHLTYEVGNCQGYSSMCIDRNGNLYASTALNDIICYQIYDDSTTPMAIYKRPRSDYSVSIDLSPDGRYLISGSVTPFACVWDTWDKSTDLPFTQLEGTLKEYYSTPCAVFSPNDPMKIVTGADDSNLTIWRFRPDGNSGSVVYKSSICESISLAPFSTVRVTEFPRFIPKLKKSLPVSSIDVYLKDLPNFVIDGQLPHLPENGRKPSSKVHTWLANFSKSSVVPTMKKTIKLKRKVLTFPTLTRLPADTLQLKNSISERSGHPKKRRRRLPSSNSATSSTGRKKSKRIDGRGENESNTESSSILKYFRPTPSPCGIGIAVPTPLRDIDNSGVLGSAILE